MQKFMLIAIAAVIVFCLLFLAGAVAVKAEPVVEFADMQTGDLLVKGFELSEKGKIDIIGVMAGARYSKHMFAYGWIIDAADREIVWTMQEDCYDVKRVTDALKECRETITLRPGKYEAYYYLGTPGIFWGDINISVNDLGDIIELVGDIFEGDKNDAHAFSEDELEEITFIIDTDVDFKPYVPHFDEPVNAVAYILQPERDEYHRQGFTLSQETELSIYAIGEYSDSYELFVDGGWIIDADDRETVWQMDKWNTEKAGGSSKNRIYFDEFTLPAGNYIVCYATDDSHDAEEWNSPPPADPFNYGITVTTTHADDIRFVSEFEERLDETEIVKMIRIRDDELEKQGFTLKEDARLHILALGERDYGDNRLCDYGWIVDVDEMETVWTMDAENTGFAGGAAKNCVFDGIIDLPKGNYLVYYRTDGSHAYGDWNSARPHDYRNWGVTISGIGKGFTEQSFEVVDQFAPTGKMLVNMTGLGDDEDMSQSFSLSESTRLKIIGLGEGKSGEMNDYGWIENDRTGEVVWEMTYRKSRHAGGASKNRSVSANLTLDKGDFTAYFVTDGSHSLEDFNASPPDEPERWGMVITRK